MIASDLFKSMIALPYSNLFTIPLKISPFLPMKSLYCLSLSAARTFWVITCLAVCAAILPKSTGGSSSDISSPIFNSSLFSLIIASFKEISVSKFSGASTILST